MASPELWKLCIQHIKEPKYRSDPNNSSPEMFDTFIGSLQPSFDDKSNTLKLMAPNSHVLNGEEGENRQQQIINIIKTICSNQKMPQPKVLFKVGSLTEETLTQNQPSQQKKNDKNITFGGNYNQAGSSCLKSAFNLESFVGGQSNELARAAAEQVSKNPGTAYNPLFVYGPTGLGKTHLIHAIGNQVKKNHPKDKVLYLSSERFVTDMIKALRHNGMEAFKEWYRENVTCLLIDDIQFFSNKVRSQEELFHTFNVLLDEEKQIVLTCDRYPKEIKGVEERLQSRFGWGLTVAIEPPELETRVAILMSKAEQAKIDLDYDVAFFIAKHIQSNVRELEGALKRVAANAQLTGYKIDVSFAKEALKDILMLQAKLVTIENIQSTVAAYYRIGVDDILSKRRNRSISMPRQIAMCLAKELTSHSYPEIGTAFGGKDHSTVLHACKKIKNLLNKDLSLTDDYKTLTRMLSA